MDKAVLEDSCRAPNGEIIIQFDKPGAWGNAKDINATNCRCCNATDIREKSKMDPVKPGVGWYRIHSAEFQQSNGAGAAFTRYGHYKLNEKRDVYSGWWTNAVPEQVVQSRCWLSKGTTPSSDQGLDTCTFGNCSSRCLSRSYSESMCCTGLSWCILRMSTHLT